MEGLEVPSMTGQDDRDESLTTGHARLSPFPAGVRERPEHVGPFTLLRLFACYHPEYLGDFAGPIRIFTYTRKVVSAVAERNFFYRPGGTHI